MEQSAGRADFRANRARLIEAAEAILREQGTAAEVKEIAERAGVGIGTFYRHFPTKDDLIIAVATEMFGVLNEALDEALSTDEPVAAVRRIVYAAAAMSERYGDLMEVLQGSLPRAFKGHIGGVDPFVRIMSLVQKGIESGDFRSDLNAAVAVSMLAGVFFPHMLQRLRGSLTIDEIVEQCLAQFLHGAAGPSH